MPTMRELSKQEFESERSVEHINTGSLQRIAAATELMAKRYTDLIDEAARQKRLAELHLGYRQDAERKLSAAKGQITKLRKQLAAMLEAEAK